MPVHSSGALERRTRGPQSGIGQRKGCPRPRYLFGCCIPLRGRTFAKAKAPLLPSRSREEPKTPRRHGVAEGIRGGRRDSGALPANGRQAGNESARLQRSYRF